MSEGFACPDCGISIDEVEPRSFSFNNPFGACPECFGLGYKMEFDENLMIPDKKLSFNEGCVQVMGWQSSSDPKSFTHALLVALADEYGFFSWILHTRNCQKDISHMFINGFDSKCVCTTRAKEAWVYMTSPLMA